MLFKKKFLNLIRQNEVRVAFRKWVRPTVKENGTLLTPIGQLRVKSLSKVTYAQIADREVREAGYQSRQELDKELGMKENGDIYKIIFNLEQPDPRIALRENTHLSDSDIIELLKKLKRLDTRGKVKHWTRKVLNLVHEEPGRVAVMPFIAFSISTLNPQNFFECKRKRLQPGLPKCNFKRMRQAFATFGWQVYGKGCICTIECQILFPVFEQFHRVDLIFEITGLPAK